MTLKDRLSKIERMVEALYRDRFPEGEDAKEGEMDRAWRELRRGNRKPMDEFEKKRGGHD